ncbi:MAG: MoaD/ThiS family protein [Methanobrevibacter sp.]|nr:MoaD/ThiS family protein [Methanobrevibacter sp.]
MNFKLIFNDKNEIKSLDNENTSIKDILEEMELSSETIVAKKNGDIVIEDEKIEDGDEIQIIQIIYGG